MIMLLLVITGTICESIRRTKQYNHLNGNLNGNIAKFIMHEISTIQKNKLGDKVIETTQSTLQTSSSTSTSTDINNENEDSIQNVMDDEINNKLQKNNNGNNCAYIFTHTILIIIQIIRSYKLYIFAKNMYGHIFIKVISI